ncbi:hypothetical protein HDU78_010439 [Chytriomyces hyalinus]|nr:hypothetical protein HDU78_010439 [Chytriomyces hyalinus]
MPVNDLLKVKERTIILVGVSGCGKTRTCYDFVRYRWCLYYDCAEDVDVLELIRLLERAAPSFKSPQEQAKFEEKCGVSNWKLDHPRSLFSFATGFVISQGLKSIWCGTCLRISSVDVICSAAGLKPTDYNIFTKFNFLTASHILKLCRKWLQEDVVNSNEALLNEISIFLQGRPRFFMMFLYKLDKLSIFEAYDLYRKEMTTNRGADYRQTSPYHFWKDRLELVVKPFVGRKKSAFNTTETVTSLLLKLSVYFFLGNGERVAFPSHLDILATNLVMIHRTPSDWDATMSEPLVLSAFLNYAADLDRYAIIDYLGGYMFAPIGSGNLSASERGHMMELIIAIRFMQAWWLESEMKEFLPAWVTNMQISKPAGVMDCRTGSGGNDVFVQQLRNPNFAYVVLPPTNAGPDLRFSVFSCSVKTTSTANSKTSMFIKTEDCRQNLQTMNPANWYKSQKSVRADVSKEIENQPFVHLRFELPDTAPGMRDSFKSGPDGKNHVICVNLQSKFALKFFGENFIHNYEEFVRYATGRFV